MSPVILEILLVAKWIKMQRGIEKGASSLAVLRNWIWNWTRPGPGYFRQLDPNPNSKNVAGPDPDPMEKKI